MIRRARMDRDYWNVSKLFLFPDGSKHRYIIGTYRSLKEAQEANKKSKLIRDFWDWGETRYFQEELELIGK
jgi:hypothetical protein